MEARPWSNSQLRKLGLALRAGAEPEVGVPAYDDVVIWYHRLAAHVLGRIAELDWQPLLGDRQPTVTSRAKTIDTLRQKLQRDPDTPLQSVQDVAGVRFEAEMSLDEQDAVAQAIAGHFGAVGARSIRDLRTDAHSGYRAVHVWLALPAGRVEVQVRTHLQGAWANVYEALADGVGRSIRYGHLPEDDHVRELVQSLQELSLNQISALEMQRNRRSRLESDLFELQRRAPTAADALNDATADLRAVDESARALELEVHGMLMMMATQLRAAPMEGR